MRRSLRLSLALVPLGVPGLSCGVLVLHPRHIVFPLLFLSCLLHRLFYLLLLFLFFRGDKGGCLELFALFSRLYWLRALLKEMQGFASTFYLG